MKTSEGGFTLVELLLSFIVLTIIALSFFDLFISLTHSAIVAKHEAVAETMATNQMEYLKTLAYNSLAVAGGPIFSTSYIPAHVIKTEDGDTYTITNNITYADDAYDGCGSYPNATLKQQYCRSYPPPSGAPTTDNNPADYKDVSVTVTDQSGLQLASLDTDVSALVAETSSNTGALFVKVVDSSGNPVTGATVNASNSTLSPVVNVSDTTDQNGIVIFYDMPPDSGYDYIITASESGYSSLSTIANSGSLLATYPNQKLVAQNSSYVTLTINPQGANSLVVETTDTSGNPLPSAKIYIKGGYKKYTATSDTSYYYDNKSPSDVRPTTDPTTGLVAVTGLAPGSYIFCGDLGATNCSVGGTTYYLAAAVPYGGSNPFNPISIPSYSASNPPSTTFAYNSTNYLQKVRLLLTTSSTFPRIANLSPSDGSIASGTLSSFSFVVNGANLPCSATASSCGTTIKFIQGASTYTASCTGTSGSQLNCTVNLSGATVGNTQLVVGANGFTFTLPASPLLGGIIVKP